MGSASDHNPRPPFASDVPRPLQCPNPAGDHAVPEVRIVVMLTCPACQGEGATHPEGGGLNACHACQFTGYQPVALPLATVLLAGADPETAYARLLDAARAPTPLHPLLYSTADVPRKWAFPALHDAPADAR